MNEDAQAERLAEAIDRVVLEGGEIEAEEEELRLFLSLAADLQRAMPPVEADPAFRASLRAKLLARPKASRWQRLRASACPRRPWVYAAGLAAAALLVVAAYLFLGYPSPQRLPSLQAQPPAAAPKPATPDASAPAPAAAVAAVPETSSHAFGASPVPQAATEAPSSGSERAIAAAPQALPSLPPLSASFPRFVTGGLGGGFVGGGEEPAREIRFELAASLPDLGATATVYRYRLPSLDLERVRGLASKLGFDPGQLRPIESAGEVAAYVISEPDKGSLEVQGPGGLINYNYHAKERESQSSAPQAPLEEVRAVEIATQRLSDLQLMPSDAGKPQVEVPFPQAQFRVVTFRPAQPANLLSPQPEVRVSVEAEGTVSSLHWLWPEVESTLSYPARTAESAWKLVESGKAQMHFQGEHARPDFKGRVRITSVEVGHTMTFALDDRPYLQPIVVFQGESILEGDPEARPFTAVVPLVADSGLPRAGISYQLVGSLPSVPVEAAALQRVGDQQPTVEWVRELGRKLGLPGEPRLLGRDGPPGAMPSWEMTDPAGEWVLQVNADSKVLQAGWSERWSFGRVESEAGVGSSLQKAPAGEAAIRIAEDFLKGKGLYSPDLGQARVHTASPDGSASLVVFQGNVEGLPIWDGGVLSVFLNARGEVQRVVSNQHPTKEVQRGRILGPEQALEAIRAGKGQIEVPSLTGRTLYSDRAEIERVELVYRIRQEEVRAQGPGPVPSGPPPLRLEPYYLFSGTLEVGESRKRLPFTTSLLAWTP